MKQLKNGDPLRIPAWHDRGWGAQIHVVSDASRHYVVDAMGCLPVSIKITEGVNTEGTVLADGDLLRIDGHVYQFRLAPTPPHPAPYIPGWLQAIQYTTKNQGQP